MPAPLKARSQRPSSANVLAPRVPRGEVRSPEAGSGSRSGKLMGIGCRVAEVPWARAAVDRVGNGGPARIGRGEADLEDVGAAAGVVGQDLEGLVDRSRARCGCGRC